jgi:hypothetical protein
MALYGADIPASKLLFSEPTSDLTQRVILLSLPLLHRSGKEGAYAALVLARVFSRTDAVQGLAGFLHWAGAELQDGDRESEASFIASLLELLALLPSMLPAGHLQTLAGFTVDVLLPHLRGTRTATGSGLIRKLMIKARGRWWLTRLSQAKESEEGGIPDGLEDQLDDLMTGLADKVCVLATEGTGPQLTRAGHYRPLLFCQIHRQSHRCSSRRLRFADRLGDHRPLSRDR